MDTQEQARDAAVQVGVVPSRVLYSDIAFFLSKSTNEYFQIFKRKSGK